MGEFTGGMQATELVVAPDHLAVDEHLGECAHAAAGVTRPEHTTAPCTTTLFFGLFSQQRCGQCARHGRSLPMHGHWPTPRLAAQAALQL